LLCGNIEQGATDYLPFDPSQFPQDTKQKVATRSTEEVEK
jgi:hypothetical protein